jgi:translocation and assembly module TamB
MRKIAMTLCLMPGMALADAAEDKGWIVNFLQDNLSGAGRQVQIDGFQGALSSQASLQRLTIADDQGVWLTLEGVTLDWSRAALLSGRVEVNALTAQSIDLARLPDSPPQAEAGSFALPDLPVSVAIAGVSAPLIRLGPGVLGQEITASLSASLGLEGGSGQGQLDLTRQDAEGHVRLTASYGNAGGVLSLDLDAAEGPGGIAASKLGVPGAPATGLRIAGTGPLSDFTAQVNLTTDGATRLGGLVTLKDGAFSALLAGDPTPVFLPDYAAFFGPNVALQVKGSNGPEGLVLDSLAVQAAALTLEGRARFAPGGRPTLLDVTGRLGLGAAVTLPLTTPVTVQSGTLRLYHDITAGPGWSLESVLNGLTTPTLAAGQIALRANGDLAEGGFDGTARVTALGLAPQDPASTASASDCPTAKA